MELSSSSKIKIPFSIEKAFANVFGSVEIENVTLIPSHVNIGTNFTNQLQFL